MHALMTTLQFFFLWGNFPCASVSYFFCFDRYAVDAMQSVCLREAGKNAIGQQAEETTLIQQMFGGYLRSKVIMFLSVNCSSDKCYTISFEEFFFMV